MPPQSERQSLRKQFTVCPQGWQQKRILGTAGRNVLLVQPPWKALKVGLPYDLFTQRSESARCGGSCSQSPSYGASLGVQQRRDGWRKYMYTMELFSIIKRKVDLIGEKHKILYAVIVVSRFHIATQKYASIYAMKVGIKLSKLITVTNGRGRNANRDSFELWCLGS